MNKFRLPTQHEKANAIQTTVAHTKSGSSQIHRASKKRFLLWYAFLAIAILFIAYRFSVVMAIYS